MTAGGHAGKETCDAKSAAVFIIGLAAGTGCTIASKYLFETDAVGSNGELQRFRPPLYQTWVMFLGMTFALPAHFIYEWHRRNKATPAELKEIEKEKPVTMKTYALLAVPSVFDLIATLLMVLGLLYTPASIWMLLRGGGIVFVALMKKYVLKHKLEDFMWAGVAVITLGVCCVGYASTVGASEDSPTSGTNAVFGVFITLAGTFVQSVQYVYEEKVMSGDVSAPPWLLIGMEGITGTILSTFVLYPLAWLMPGDDNGSYEDPVNTFAMVQNSQEILFLSVTFCVLVFILNSFSVLVTYMMSSVWHAILDNFRPVTIWIVMIDICFVTEGQHGECPVWPAWGYQLIGMTMLIVGTAIYNGSINLHMLGLSAPKISLTENASDMASPALARSPLITHNRSPFAQSSSPYVQRAEIERGGNPMVLGVSTNAKERLLPR